MRTGRNFGPLLLGLFVGLSIIAALGVTPAYAKGSGSGPTYSCAVSGTYTTNTFYVKTTVTATGGYFPGPNEKNNVKAHINGGLYKNQSSKYSKGNNDATNTLTITLSSKGSGTYTFQSSILKSQGG